ncbi:hypothetical protein KTO58_21760 [Chitinophaga pendula]|uniref:hypothetical protein n=1 Tax=Chitinophaga TaxID=79328 RepID=UPI0012FE033D|nr:MULTISPECIES: hypothetical protein [Chitinophaga]UCJ06274.1 hypothetical protein KTO58_21760 [Chitinophaga pendula]
MKKAILSYQLFHSSHAILSRVALSKLFGGGVGSFGAVACPKEDLLECIRVCREEGMRCQTRTCSCI